MFAVLDPRQLARIEAVHRGFLYQHLYTVGCLLLAAGSHVRSITAEFDEDVEIEFESGDRIYIQVKTRSTPLIWSDISGALARFEELQNAHSSGPVSYTHLDVYKRQFGKSLAFRGRTPSPSATGS